MPCSQCGQADHNVTTCSNWIAAIDPTYFHIDYVPKSKPKPNYKNIIKKTNESQGHGKAVEIDISKSVFGINSSKIKSYKNTSIHDIPKEDNKLKEKGLFGKNISIKTTLGDSICCGKISRLIEHLFPKQNVVMILSCLKQKNKKQKEVKKTYLIDLSKIFKGQDKDVLLNFKKDIEEYEKYIHNLSCGKISNEYLKKAKEIMDKYPSICNILTINAKVDSKSQRRVQCSFKITILKENGFIINEWDRAKIYNKNYCGIIESPSRNMGGVTIYKMKEYAKLRSINGPGKRGGWTNMKKNEILDYLINKGHPENEIIEYFQVNY